MRDRPFSVGVEISRHALRRAVGLRTGHRQVARVALAAHIAGTGVHLIEQDHPRRQGPKG
jgi:hypothetical protein